MIVLKIIMCSGKYNVNESERTTDYFLFNPYSENLHDILNNTAHVKDTSQTKDNNINTALAIEQLAKVKDNQCNTVLIVPAESGNLELLNQFLERFEYIQSPQKSTELFQKIDGSEYAPRYENFMNLMKNENFLSNILNKKNIAGKTVLMVLSEKSYDAIVDKLEAIIRITSNPASPNNNSTGEMSSATFKGPSDLIRRPVVPGNLVSAATTTEDPTI